MPNLQISSSVLEIKEAKTLTISNISLLDARLKSLNMNSELGKRMADFYAKKIAAQKAVLDSLASYDLAVWQ